MTRPGLGQEVDSLDRKEDMRKEVRNELFPSSGKVHRPGDDPGSVHNLRRASGEDPSIGRQGWVPDRLEIAALHDLYTSTGGDGWSIQQDSDPGNDWPRDKQWEDLTDLTFFSNAYGIEISDGDITAIELIRNQHAGIGLGGHLPATLGDLSALRVLILSHNDLAGTIPHRLGDLHRLSTLRLDHNDLSGAIPASIFRLQAIEVIALNHNALEGALPQYLMSRDYLLENRRLQDESEGQEPIADKVPPVLPGERMSPADVAGLIPGSYLNVRRKDGPDDERKITDAIWQDMINNNRIVVPGSSERDKPDLTNVHAWSNPRLRYLDLSNNRLEGEMPSWISRYATLEYLDVSENELNGTLPDSFGSLMELLEINVSGTRLEGAIPGSILRIPGLAKLRAHDARFSELPELATHPNRSAMEVKLASCHFDFDALEKLFTGPGEHPFALLNCVPQHFDQVAEQFMADEYDRLTLEARQGGQYTRWQWQQFDGNQWADIPGARSRSLLFESLSLSDSGSYRCRISNDRVQGLVLEDGLYLVKVADVKKNYAVASGAWSDPHVWGGDPGVPDRHRIVEINGFAITVTHDQQSGRLKLSNEKPGTRLIVSSGHLEVYGDVSVANVKTEKDRCRLEVSGAGKLSVYKTK
jgi:Leucine-rich repeat (LRR) protein